jgi:murein DD-endopeptidase MepM/ murein hydrolase activator NlpD
VLGLRFTEPPPPAPDVARSDLALQLPFRGRWRVVWGGDTVALNQHADQPSQRRAADLVMQGSDGRSHRGEGKQNEDYLAYGQEILAVAAGEVVTVIDGVPENSPGSMNPYLALGNAVIVRHPADLYSVYAHLQPGKLRVKPGAKLKQGAVLGLCGNSGNSSEPHLHFQLQDGPRVEASWGVEAVFRGVAVVRAGAPGEMADYTFLQGDVVGSDGLGAHKP